MRPQVLLVFDVSSRSSFDALGSWLTEVAEHERDRQGSCLVVGTKVRAALTCRVMGESGAPCPMHAPAS